MSNQNRAYLEPLKEEMARVEAELTKAEERVRELRKERSGLGRGLAALDPRWAATHFYHGKNKSTGTHKGTQGASPERVAEVAQWLRENKPSETFTNQSLSAEIGLHGTTVARVTKQLHDQGVLRIDHMSGQRKTQKNFRLVTADNA